MIKRIGQILRFTMAVLGVGGILLFFLPRLLGCIPRVVISGSMEPEILVGSVVYTSEQIPEEQIAVGDVIAYRLTDQVTVLHRVMEVNKQERTWVTKGDANVSADLGKISYDQYLGKMILAVPYAGYAAEFFKNPWVLKLAVCAGGYLLLIDGIEQKKRREEIG